VRYPPIVEVLLEIAIVPQIEWPQLDWDRSAAVLALRWTLLMPEIKKKVFNAGR
jgi:hypothetical protein